MYQENYINSLRAEMVSMVETQLSGIAQEYGYSDVPLETTIKWRPMVLVLGNYSSGKSTLINEFLGADIQAIGQAPTDDSFTIITYDGTVPDTEAIRITEQRDGKFLLNDPEYPFEILKKHGQRFAAHFRLKKVNSPFLKNLALIDTPGMLDSITERDRGYNYQEIIGDLAHLADLVLVLFDPHKAGTVREAHTSIRETIAKRTYEDRVLYILNRIDECASLGDLLQVYGTLCWNLSQITGRKDIPPIHLTYSSRASQRQASQDNGNYKFLYLLENQRKQLKDAVLQAPRHRLDNMATFVETHAERLNHFLEAILSYRSRLRRFRFKFGLLGFVLGLFAGGLAVFGGLSTGILGGLTHPVTLTGGVGVVILFMIFWMMMPMRYIHSAFHRNYLKNIDQLIPLDTQTRRDSWQAVRDLVYTYLQKSKGRFPLYKVKEEYTKVNRVYEEGSREIRRALNELAGIEQNRESIIEDSSKPLYYYQAEEEPPEPDTFDDPYAITESTKF
ncbi:MAG: dynamin family protein [Desulfobacterales bacterium]|nr:dynamin family protein [Desulfobacterales bacterium]